MNHATRVIETTANEQVLTFGDLIAAVYGACGKGQARGILTLALHARLIEFTGDHRFIISEPRSDKNL